MVTVFVLMKGESCQRQLETIHIHSSNILIFISMKDSIHLSTEYFSIFFSKKIKAIA